MIRSFFKFFSSLFLIMSVVVPSVFALDVPRQDSRTKSFYIFGPQGNTLDGKESDEFKLYIQVPSSAKGDVTIHVMDPDSVDAGIVPYDSEMEYSVLGKDGQVLDSKVFGEGDYNNKAYSFGPYKKSQGEKIGDHYQFELFVKALSGDDFNTFSVQVSPNQADVYAETFTFVLLPNRGDKMFFYPEIPAGIQSITVRNYDLDRDGGVSELYDAVTRKTHKVKDSESGQWAETKINITSDVVRRLEYRVTTTNQTRGHAGLQFIDDQGRVLPIYFRKGKAPVAPAPVKEVPAPAPQVNLACNQFTFDASSSYDVNNDKLDFEWQFGDGETSVDPTVTHVYAKGGSYKVTLKVTDNSGLKCSTASTSEDVYVNTPPSASFTGPEVTCVNNELTFNASASSDDHPEKMTYLWNFGDGAEAEGATVSHAFEKGGVYDVVLTVNDNEGTACSKDSIRQMVRVNSAPVANAGEDVTLYLKNPKDAYKINFDGSDSYDADRQDLSYRWNFGDGESAEGVKVEHTYAAAGEYDVRLTVNDGSQTDCDTSSDSLQVKLNKAPVADAGQPQHACQGNTVTFDASGSSTEEGESLDYSWDFGDGKTGTGKVVEHTYDKGGNYEVVLTVDDGRGTPVSQSSTNTTVWINSSPRAVLNQVEKSCVGDSLTLDASASSDADGDSLKYSWDFGDGTKADGKSKVSHTYSKGGSYTVRVTADDGRGSECSISVDTIQVEVNTAPVANAGPNLACCSEESTAFDGTSSQDPDGDTLTYAWDFGDGQGSNQAKTEHSYAQSGNYEVVLQVDDQSGTSCSSSASHFTANVNAQPVPVIKIKQK